MTLLFASACFATLVTGVFATNDPLVLILYNMLAMLLGWLLATQARPVRLRSCT